MTSYSKIAAVTLTSMMPVPESTLAIEKFDQPQTVSNLSLSISGSTSKSATMVAAITRLAIALLISPASFTYAQQIILNGCYAAESDPPPAGANCGVSPPCPSRHALVDLRHPWTVSGVTSHLSWAVLLMISDLGDWHSPILCTELHRWRR